MPTTLPTIAEKPEVVLPDEITDPSVDMTRKLPAQGGLVTDTET